MSKYEFEMQINDILDKAMDELDSTEFDNLLDSVDMMLADFSQKVEESN